MRKPGTKKELRSFLETIGFYQKYIDRYAEKGKALTDMLKKGELNQIKWDAESKESFQTLKTALTQKPILRLPNFEKQLVLQTDASDSGLGAVLLQEYCTIKLYRYVSKYNLPLTVLLHANCYTPFHGARERVTSGGAVWLVFRVVFVVAINTCNTLQWRRVRDTNSCERLITCSSVIRDK